MDEKYDLTVRFKSTRVLNTIIDDSELNWLFDVCFGRKQGNFIILGENEVINVNEIEYFIYKKVKTDEIKNS